MAPVVIALIAMLVTSLCVFFWFRNVRRIMQERKNTVDCAGKQLSVYKSRALKTRNDPAAAAISERCERIYWQAVELYNQTLRKTAYYLPARLMGYHQVS